MDYHLLDPGIRTPQGQGHDPDPGTTRPDPRSPRPAPDPSHRPDPGTDRNTDPDQPYKRRYAN